MKNEALLTPRQIAGRLNRQKRRGISPEGRERLRGIALKYQPWKHAKGPRSALGRAESVINGKRHQKGVISVRERRRQVADVLETVKSMQALEGPRWNLDRAATMALSLVAILRQIDPAIRRDHRPDRVAIRSQMIRTFARTGPWSPVTPFRRDPLHASILPV